MLNTIGSDNDLVSGLCQAIIWTNGFLLLIATGGTNFSENSIKFNNFHSKNISKHRSAQHWNRHVFIFMKFSSLAALEVVILTTSGAASDGDFIKMTTFPFQWMSAILLFRQYGILANLSSQISIVFNIQPHEIEISILIKHSDHNPPNNISGSLPIPKTHPTPFPKNILKTYMMKIKCYILFQ